MPIENLLLAESPSLNNACSTDLCGSAQPGPSIQKLCECYPEMTKDGGCLESSPLLGRSLEDGKVNGISTARSVARSVLHSSSCGRSVLSRSSKSRFSKTSRSSIAWSFLTVALRDKDMKRTPFEDGNRPGLSGVILDGVSGYALPGKVSAIMGASGCGKTTLLNALAGNLGPEFKVSGNVKGTSTRLQYQFFCPQILLEKSTFCCQPH